MKKFLLLAFGCLIALPALTQVRQFKIAEIIGKGDTVTYINLVTQVIVPKDGMTIKYKTPPDTAKLFLPNDGFEYVATTTFKKIGPIITPPASYDTIYTIAETLETENPRVQHVNMTTATNSGKPGVSNKSFSYVTDATKLSSSSLQFTGAMIEVWSERFSGHGNLDIYIDNVKVASFNQGLAPLGTDYARNNPTYRKKLPVGSHIITVSSSSGQHMIDFFNVYAYTLQPKP